MAAFSLKTFRLFLESDYYNIYSSSRFSYLEVPLVGHFCFIYKPHQMEKEFRMLSLLLLFKLSQKNFHIFI